MNNSTVINKTALTTWATNIYEYNNEANDNLQDLKTSVDTLTDVFSGVSGEAIVSHIDTDLETGMKVHTNMQKLETFLEKVVESAENS